MKCYHPVNIDGGIKVPCGRCIGCRANKSQEWGTRLMHHLDYSDGAIFVTLTYNNDNLPYDLSIKKTHLQNFFKRLRSKLIKRKIKYYACGEYGDETFRPHYHAIIFNMSVKDENLISESWQLGFVRVEKVIEERINYVTGYVLKKIFGKKGKELYGKKEAPFALMSKGLGKGWIENEENEKHVLLNMGIRKKGKVVPIPRYYVGKMKHEIPKEVWNEIKVNKYYDKKREYEDNENNKDSYEEHLFRSDETGRSIRSRKQKEYEAIQRFYAKKRKKI